MRRHLAILLAAIVCLVMPAGETAGQDDEAASKRKQKFIYVPFEDLDKALKNQKHGVVLEFEEYMRLLREAGKKAFDKPPASLSMPVIHSSSYSGTVGEEQVRFSGQLTFTSLAKGYTRLFLPFGAVGITSARLDGKPARVVLSENGYALLLAPGHSGSKHTLELSFAAPLKKEKRGRSLGLRIPPAPSATVTLTMPGKAHVTVSPDLCTTSYSKESDATTVVIHAGGKDFVLAHMAAEERKTDLEPFITADAELLVRLAPSLVTARCRLDVKAYRQKIPSLKISVPKAYRITELRCTDMLGWTEEESDSAKLLTVSFRKPLTDTGIALTLENELAANGGVEVPRIEIPGALANTPLVQVMADDGVSFEVESSENLNEVTPKQPGFPDVKKVPAKAFTGWPQSWSLALRVSRVSPVVTSLLTTLVSIERTMLSLNFLCTFEVKEGGLYSCGLSMPAQWEILSVATGLAPDRYDYTVTRTGGENVIEVLLRHRLVKGSVLPVSVSARLIPDSPGWEEMEAAVPRITPKNAKLRLGTIVFRAREAMSLSGREIDGLSDLDVSQIEHRGIAAWKTTLGYEVKKDDYSGTVAARMKKPRVSAACITYLAVNESLFQAMSLLTMRFDERPASEFQFILPAGTGETVDIRGSFIKEKSLLKHPDGDRWRISLQKEVLGEYSLYIAHDLKMGKEASELAAPKILVPGVRCDGFIGVEAGMGIEIQAESRNLREIPISALPRQSALERYYIPRRSIIHAFRYIGTDYSLKLKVTKRPLASVLNTVVPAVFYKTVYSADGVERTRAFFELTSTGDQFFEFRLPEGAKLWSVLLGRTIDKLEPVKPARRANLVMVPLTAAPPPAQGGESAYYISATYQRAHSPMAGSGTVELALPALDENLPVLQSKWMTYLPPDYRYTPDEDKMILETTRLRQPAFLEYTWEWLLAVLALMVALVYAKLLHAKVHRRAIVYATIASVAIIMSVLLLLTMYSAGLSIEPSAEIGAETCGTPAISVTREFAEQEYDPTLKRAMFKTPRIEAEVMVEKPVVLLEEEVEITKDVPRGTSFDNLSNKNLDRAKAPEADYGLAEGRAGAYGQRWRGPVPQDKEAKEPAAPPLAGRPKAGEEAPEEEAPSGAITELADDIRKAKERQRGLLSLSINLQPEGTPLTFHSLSGGGNISIDYVSHQQAFAGCLVITLCAFLVPVFLRKKPLAIKLLYALTGLAIFSFLPSIAGVERTVYCNAAVFGIVAGILFLGVSALAQYYRKAVTAVAIILALFLLGFESEPAAAGGGQAPAGKAQEAPAEPRQDQFRPRPQPPKKPEPVKEPEPDVVIVPYDPKDLSKVPGKGRVHVAVKRYEELLRGAGLLPEKPEESPRLFSASSATYNATILGNSADFTVEMSMELLRSEAAEVFIGFPGIALTDAKLGEAAAKLRSTASGYYLVLTESGAHTFSAKFSLPLDPEKVNGSIEFPVRPVPCALLTVKSGRPDTDVIVRSAIGGQEVTKTEKGAQVRAALGAANAISISYGPPSSRVTSTLQAIDAKLAHYHWLSERLVLARCDASLRVSGEQKDSFSFKLPADFEVYQVVSPREIMAWRILDQSGGARLLEILFYEPVKEELNLTVNGARILREKTGKISLPFLETAGARRETGSVSVFLADTLRGNVTHTRNLVQVASAAKTRDRYELHSAFEHSARPLELTFATAEKKPDVRTNIYSQVAVTRKKLFFKTVAQLKVAQAPVYDITLRVPGEFEIEDVACNGMTSKLVKENAGETLVVVHLSKGIQGDISITVSGSRTAPDDLTELNLPAVTVAGARFAEGFVVASSDEGISLSTRKTQNLIPVDVRSVPYPKDGALPQGAKRLAFAWKRTDYSGTIGVEKPLPSLSADCVTSALVKDEVVAFTTILKYEIKSAPCRRFSFSMPYSLSEKVVMTVPFERQKILKKEGEGEEARAVWTIELQRELTDSYHIAVNWEEIARDGNVFAFPRIVPESVDSARVYIMLQNRSGLKVTELKKSNLDAADREHIPLLAALQLKRAIFLNGYKVRDAGKDYSHSFSIQRLKEEKDIQAIVDIAEISTVINRQGFTFNEVSYRIQNRTRQYLKVQLPAGARLWSAEVAGRLTKPAMPAGGGGGTILLPLLKRGKGELSYTVKVFYSLKLDSKPGFGRTMALKPPKPLDINVGQTFWTVYAPGEYEYSCDGNMEEVIEAVREVEKVTSYAQEAQRLARELDDVKSEEQRQQITDNISQFNDLMQEQLKRAEAYQKSLAGQEEVKAGKFTEQYQRNFAKLKEAQLALTKNISRVQDEKAKQAQQAAEQRTRQQQLVTPQAEQASQAEEFLEKAQKRVREQIVQEEKARLELSELDRLSNKNLDSTSCIDAYGIGGGRAGAYGQRWGKGSLAREGGSPGTESAVSVSLRWLHFHQDPDGKWDGDGFSRNCDGRQGVACSGRGAGQYDVALTGLSLLAFLGNGQTHRVGMFKKTVERALNWLVHQQQPDGSFGARAVDSWIYNHAIAACALCEAFAVTRDYKLQGPAQRAIDFIRSAQNSGFGWKYQPRSGRNDTSVTGWMVMALKAAKAARLNVEQSMFDGAVNWFDRVTDGAGKTGYMRPGDDGSVIRGVNEHYAKLPTMTAVAVLCRIFCGQSRRDPQILKGVDILMANLPRWNKPSNTTVDMYYWYYGTYAMFQYGGTNWHRWNEAMKRALLNNQRVGGCADGSWDPVGKWGKIGGRVYATAINTLTLEIYYRYSRAARGKYGDGYDWKDAEAAGRAGEHGARAQGFLPPQIRLPRAGTTLSFKKLGTDPVLILSSSDTRAYARIYAFVRLASLLLLLAVAFLLGLSFFGRRDLSQQASESAVLGIAALLCILTVWIALPVICACVVLLVLAKTRRLKIAR